MVFVSTFLCHPARLQTKLGAHSGNFIGEAVFARCLSSLKDERITASKTLQGPKNVKYEGDHAEFVEHIRKV